MTANATAVHVHFDGDHAHRIGVREYYSVSLVDDEGDEIACVDGSEYIGDAWEAGLEIARERCIPCVEYAREDGQETDRWEPTTYDEEVSQ
jgi:hypothetical protein